MGNIILVALFGNGLKEYCNIKPGQRYRILWASSFFYQSQIWKSVIQWSFPVSLVPIGRVISEEMIKSKIAEAKTVMTDMFLWNGLKEYCNIKPGQRYRILWASSFFYPLLCFFFCKTETIGRVISEEMIKSKIAEAKTVMTDMFLLNLH
jgi:hypothetical protein